LIFEEAHMSGLARVIDAQRRGRVFLNPAQIRSVHEISEGTEITLTVLTFSVVGALLATIVRGLANLGDALRKKLVRGSWFTSSPVHPLVDRRDPG
jgi:hypothetical protein